MKWHILAQRKRAQAFVEWHAHLQNFPEQQKCGGCASKNVADVPAKSWLKIAF
jgi:hypothetical protein